MYRQPTERLSLKMFKETSIRKLQGKTLPWFLESEDVGASYSSLHVPVANNALTPQGASTSHILCAQSAGWRALR